MLIGPVGQRTANVLRWRKHAHFTDNNNSELEGNLRQWKNLVVVDCTVRNGGGLGTHPPRREAHPQSRCK